MSMTEQESQHRGRLYGAFAFASVILACFSGYFFERRFYHGETLMLLSFGLGALYAALGVLSNECTESGKPALVTAYFFGQCALLTAMVFLSPIRGFFGIIVLPVVSQAIFDLNRRAAVIVGLYLFVVSVGVWGVDFGLQSMLEVSFNYVPAFAFTVAFTLISKQALNAREQSEKLRQELEVANLQLREHAAQVGELATTRERNRVAREIHDGVGHYLTVVKTQLDAASALMPTQPDKARDAVAKAAALTGEALEDVRRSVGSLRTDTARPLLPVSLRSLVRDAGLPVVVRVEGEIRQIAPGVEHALFRAAQEALTNMRKHAGATAAEVLLDCRTPHRLTLAFTDNGQGRTGADTAGFGLRGIRERIEVLGGTVQSGNRPAGGFFLTIEVPA